MYFTKIINFILTTFWTDRLYYHSHFTDKETEALGSERLSYRQKNPKTLFCIAVFGHGLFQAQKF
jgi:hypothetical protein